MSGEDIVYFDLETQLAAHDVGGWAHKDRMRMSIGVTFSTRLGEYRIFQESEADELLTQLQRASLVVGFNHVGFDYAVLQRYSPLDLAFVTANLDLLLDLEPKIGHRPKLEAVAQATLGVGKTTEGLQAILWWREGKIREIAEYCAYDVKVTMRLHEFGRRHGFVRYADMAGTRYKIPVSW